MRHLSIVLVVTLSAAGGIGCSSNTPGDSLVQVNQMVGWIERVHASNELAKGKVDAAIENLQTIARVGFKGDAVATYKTFAVTVDASTKQLNDLNLNIATMKQAAEPVFKQWVDDLEAFKSMDMRLRSQQRLKETRQRYDNLLAAADMVETAYDAFDEKLRDCQTFLGNDFNAAAVTAIKGEVRSLVESASHLNVRFDACQEAARVYVEAAALPTNLQEPEPSKATPTKRPRRSNG